MTRRVRAGVDPDDSQVSGPGPAAEHALLVDHPCTAAAIHVLDSIHSDVFPRSAVTMAGVDWAAIAEVRPMLSSGEQALTDAAEDLDLVGQVGGLTLAEVRQRVDVEGNARVRDAMVMVGQTVPDPDPDREYDGDYQGRPADPAGDPMTAWERLLEEPTLRPLGSPCRICGDDPEQRHRVWDVITERWQAGESLVEVAADYEVTPDDVAAVMVAQGEWLTAEARWWAERLLTARPERVDLKTDRVDLWIDGLLADEQEAGR